MSDRAVFFLTLAAAVGFGIALAAVFFHRRVS